jgi:hypothetical protein
MILLYSSHITALARAFKIFVLFFCCEYILAVETTVAPVLKELREYVKNPYEQFC